VLLRIVPGNIVDILFDAAGYVDPADKAKLERELGLDQPIVVQYLHWIGGLLHGDLGYSYVSEKPALDEILPRIPITARLAGLALLFSASRSAFRSGSSARSSRAPGSIMRCASSA
jgi:peptide/nickel transport system permease protein